MHHGHHTHGRRRRFARRMMMRRYRHHLAAMGHGPCSEIDDGLSPEERLRFLEEYQRDLEQEVADVADRIATFSRDAETPA